jgi:serine/threonine protein kinase
MSSLSFSQLSAQRRDELDGLLDRFEKDWRAGRPLIEDVLSDTSGAERRLVLAHALRLELELRRGRGEAPAREEYERRFRDEKDLVVQVFAEGVTEPHAVGTSLPGVPQVPGYAILDVLGEGGMGIVYLARDLNLNRDVALKMVRVGWGGPEEKARAESEAKALAQLNHPNVVQIYDVGEHDGLPFLSLEHASGGTLKDRLQKAPQPVRSAARFVEMLAGVIHVIHERGLVHRDLKPANILLEGDRRLPLEQLTPKVSDFGLAKHLDAGRGRTIDGAIVGTPSYMAPEQASGKSKEAGPPADVHALGAILYECLTGRPPFLAATVTETLLQVISEEPVSPRQLNPVVDRSLAAVCLKCLEKKSKDRYPTAAALAADLKRWLNGEPIPLEPWWQWLWRQFQSPCRLDRPREWAHVFWYLAAWRLITHGAMALLLQLGPAPATYWAWFIGLHLGTWLPIGWLLRSDRRLNPIERGTLLNWGATFVCDAILLALFCPPWGPARPEEVVRVYPAWQAAHALWYVMEARRSWGRFYAVGIGYFVAAPLLLLCGLMTPVAYALVVAGALLWLADGFRSLANQQAADLRAAQKAAGASPLRTQFVDD